MFDRIRSNTKVFRFELDLFQGGQGILPFTLPWRLSMVVLMRQDWERTSWMMTSVQMAFCCHRVHFQGLLGGIRVNLNEVYTVIRKRPD